MPRNSPRSVKTEDTLEEDRRELIASLHRRGWTVWQISCHPKIRISRVAVYAHIKKIRLQLVESQKAERAEQVAEKLAEYREVRMEAWEAWERSKQDKERVTSEMGKPFKLKADKGGKVEMKPLTFGTGPNGRRKEPLPGTVEEELILLKKIINKEGRTGDAAYLEVVFKTLQAERELLGLDAATQLELSLTAGVKTEAFTWDQFLAEASNPPPNLPQERLEQMESMAASNSPLPPRVEGGRS